MTHSGITCWFELDRTLRSTAFDVACTLSARRCKTSHPDWLLALRRCPESCLSPAARTCTQTPQAPYTQPEPIASIQHRSPSQAAAAARASQQRTGVVHSYRSVRLAVSSPGLPKHRCKNNRCAVSNISPALNSSKNCLSFNSET